MATLIANRVSERRTFQRPAHLLYAILGVELVCSVSLALDFGFRPASPVAFLPQLWCILLVISGPLARRIDHPRIGGACETVGFIYGQGFALVALLYPMTALAGPFADTQLNSADKLIGFDWLALAAFFHDKKRLLDILNGIYWSFGWQAAIIFPALFIARQDGRAWRAILAANVSLLLCMLTYPFAPGLGPFDYFGIRPEDYPNLQSIVPWCAGPAIEAIRDHGARLITRDLMVPFISFPSYHAAAAVIFAWAAWPMRWLRWPFLALNISMAFAALIVGSHYLVDILGGFAVAAAALLLVKKVIASECPPDSLGDPEFDHR